LGVFPKKKRVFRSTIAERNAFIFGKKNILYPEFEPRTSGISVGSLKHCIIGSVYVAKI
jgi:hypothetical protein